MRCMLYSKAHQMAGDNARHSDLAAPTEAANASVADGRPIAAGNSPVQKGALAVKVGEEEAAAAHHDHQQQQGSHIMASAPAFDAVQCHESIQQQAVTKVLDRAPKHQQNNVQAVTLIRSQRIWSHPCKEQRTVICRGNGSSSAASRLSPLQQASCRQP